jgi:ABC-2 type transport system ATP-binding protein
VDPISRRDFWRILAELGGQGVTVILSSPYMDEAARCHRLVMMSRGRILAEGTADDVRQRVPHSVLEVLTPNVREAGRVLAGAPGVSGVVEFGDALHVFVAPGCSPRDVEGSLAAGSVPFVSVEAVEPSLEDAFLELAAGEGPR